MQRVSVVESFVFVFDVEVLIPLGRNMMHFLSLPTASSHDARLRALFHTQSQPVRQNERAQVAVLKSMESYVV